MVTKGTQVTDKESHVIEEVLPAPDIMLQAPSVEPAATIGDASSGQNEEATEREIENNESLRQLKRKGTFHILSVGEEAQLNENVIVHDTILHAQLVVNLGDGQSAKKEMLVMKLEKNDSPKRLKMKKPFPPFSVLHPYGYKNWDLCARDEQKFAVQHYMSRKRMKLLLDTTY